MTRAIADTRPRKLGSQNTHFWLAQSMAKRTGTDLCAAYERGDLKQSDWAVLISRCRGCTWVKGCQRFLARPESGQHAIPASCANHADLQSLKSAQED